jgi:spermidine/putrescine transport system substrate-binding protein
MPIHKDDLARLTGPDRRQLLAVLAAAGGVFVAGRTPAFADTTVNWVGWQGYDEPLKLGSFLKDNGIALATTYINTNEEIITRLQAGGAGQVDFITIYYGHIPILVAADLVEAIDESKVPGIADIFPEFLNVDPIRKDGKLYAVPFTWGTLSMIYDPAATPKPTSWKDALKDDVKGKVAMVDDMTGLLATWAPIVVGTKTPTRLTMAELKKTNDFLIDIKKNHARTLSSSYGEAVDLFARGEVVTSAMGWDAMVGFAAAKNKVLDFVIPEEGVMVFMDTLAIPKGAPHLDLAYKMLGQCISAAGQKQIADALTQAVITKAALPMIADKNKKIYHYDNLQSEFEKARFYPFWPLEPQGDFVTHEQVQEDYQRVLKA